jgi:hypothetical protein
MIRLREQRSRRGAGIAPGLAHADRLRALTRAEKNVLVRHRCVS